MGTRTENPLVSNIKQEALMTEDVGPGDVDLD